MHRGRIATAIGGEILKWFKHYTVAHDDAELAEVCDELGLVGYAYFWILAELCAAKYEGDSASEFTLSRRGLASKFRCKPARVGYILRMYEESGLFSLTELNNNFIIEWPKLLKFVHRDAFSSSQRPATNRPLSGPTKAEVLEEKNKKNNKTTNVVFTPQPDGGQSVGAITDIENFSDPVILDFFQQTQISQNSQKAWFKLYDAEYIKIELIKMVAWCSDNSQRCPKSARGWASFVTKWLGRGWERHRKTIASVDSQAMREAEILEGLNARR